MFEFFLSIYLFFILLIFCEKNKIFYFIFFFILFSYFLNLVSLQLFFYLRIFILLHFFIVPCIISLKNYYFIFTNNNNFLFYFILCITTVFTSDCVHCMDNSATTPSNTEITSSAIERSNQMVNFFRRPSVGTIIVPLENTPLSIDNNKVPEIPGNNFSMNDKGISFDEAPANVCCANGNFDFSFPKDWSRWWREGNAEDNKFGFSGYFNYYNSRLPKSPEPKIGP